MHFSCSWMHFNVLEFFQLIPAVKCLLITLGSWILTGSRKEHASASCLSIILLLKVVLCLGFVEEVRGVVHDSQQFRQPPLPSPPPGWQLWACFFSQLASYVSTPGFQHTTATKKVLAAKFDRASGAPGCLHWRPLPLKSGSGSSMLINLFILWHFDSQACEFDQFLLYFTPVHFILRISFMAVSIQHIYSASWHSNDEKVHCAEAFVPLSLKNKKTNTFPLWAGFYQKLWNISCRKGQVDQVLRFCNMNKWSDRRIKMQHIWLFWGDIWM